MDINKKDLLSSKKKELETIKNGYSIIEREIIVPFFSMLENGYSEDNAKDQIKLKKIRKYFSEEGSIEKLTEINDDIKNRTQEIISLELEIKESEMTLEDYKREIDLCFQLDFKKGYFYESKFLEAIRLAKKSGSSKLVDETYERIMNYNNNDGGFIWVNDELAAYCAIEGGKIDLAKKIITNMVKISNGSSNRIEIEYAGMINEEYKNEIIDLINKKKKEKVVNCNIIQEKKYISKSGAHWQMDNKGYLYRNGIPFTSSVGGVYKYGGITNNKEFAKIFYEKGGGGTIPSKTIYRILKKYNFLTEIDFNNIGNFDGVENKSIVAIIDEIERAQITNILIK